VRGFRTGIGLGGSGHLVEDNLLQGSLYMGIDIDGDHNVVRRNRVFDTGGNGLGAFGIVADADILDNIVDGVSASGSRIVARGIGSPGSGTRIAGNRVSGLNVENGAAAQGIVAWGHNQAIVGNRVAAASGSDGIDGGGNGLCAGNTVAGFTTPYENCHLVDGTYNASH
jgi:hypothetical protein